MRRSPRVGSFLPSDGDLQAMQPLQVPADAHQRPLVLHRLQTSQQELAEPEHGLDDPEGRLHRAPFETAAEQMWPQGERFFVRHIGK